MFPYDDIPYCQRWPNIGDRDRDLLELMGPSKFALSKSAKIASAGSCFAQRLGEQLRSFGLAHMNDGPESPYATDYGNIYSARQLKQLLERCTGRFVPQERVWKTPSGLFVDPFRPFVHHPGLERPEDVEIRRIEHFDRVRLTFEHADAFVFTLGLTEIWIDARDGAVFPACPGKQFGTFDPGLFLHKTLSVEETIEDLDEVLSILFEINPSLRVILSVSPVAIAATLNPMHVVRASVLTKSVLKVAAEAVAATSTSVDYFPAYDVVVQSFGESMFASDHRHVADDVPFQIADAFVRRYFDMRERFVSGGPGEADADECDEDRLLRSISVERATARTVRPAAGKAVAFPRPIFFVGDSGTLVFDQALCMSPNTGDGYLGAAVHCPGLSCFDLTQPDANLNRHVVEKLVAARVLREVPGGYDAFNELRRYGRHGAEVPPVVLFCGAHDVARLWNGLEERLIDLPADVRPAAYAVSRGDDCSFEEACRFAESIVAPLFTGIEILQTFGLRDVIVHAIAPRARADKGNLFSPASLIESLYYGMNITLNHVLRAQCSLRNIPFIDISDHVLGADGYRDERYSLDPAHLNTEAATFTFEKVICVLESRA